jgi:serine/threonine protein kinase
VRQLAASQTCQIWEAIRDSDDARVAIKALHKRYASDRGQIATLQHEFEVGKQLEHPNVCRAFEYNVYRGTPFLVMEFMSPRSMKQMIRDQYDQLEWLIPVILGHAAEGLGYFHQRGWLHRDVKPDNFLIGNEGEVKLIDYSIAKKQKRGLSKLLFGKSKVQGTRSYMAPEQIRGESLDARADIYSFGCTVFELIARRLPYTGVSAEDLLNKHLKATIPSMIAVNDNVTPQFNALIAKTMAKHRNERPKSMAEFVEELAAIRIFHNRPRKPDADSD